MSDRRPTSGSIRDWLAVADGREFHEERERDWNDYPGLTVENWALTA